MLTANKLEILSFVTPKEPGKLEILAIAPDLGSASASASPNTTISVTEFHGLHLFL
jgi:hypothetical protein